MDNAAFWNKIAPKYAKDSISDMAAYSKTRDRMIEILQPHHNVLELGCGTGSTALELAAGVAQYVATDISSEMIKIANAKLAKAPNANLSFLVHDAETIWNGSHDVVLALNLMHLLPNLEDVLGEIFAALPSGGLLIAKTGLLKDGLWVLPLIIPVMRMIGKAPYVRSLRRAQFLQLLKNAGFEITEELTQSGAVPRTFTVARKP